MERGPLFLLVGIFMLMTAEGSVATSRFLGDFGLCIVDTKLMSTAPDQILIFSTNPIVQRGTAGSYDKQRGEIEINDDGTYVFIIHRTGVSLKNSGEPLLLKLNNATDHNVTLAEIADNGYGTISTANVLAELKMGDKVFINTQGADVNGNETHPFIFTVFLLYHDPIVSFPQAHQSNFLVTGVADLTVADSIIDDFEPPTINIGDGFDSLTGVFTAPFEGLYVFDLEITFKRRMKIYRGIVAPSTIEPFRRRRRKPPQMLFTNVALTVNGDTIAQVSARFPMMAYRSKTPRPPKNTGISVARNLNQGDEVSLRNIEEVRRFEGQVTFGGYLLS